MNVIYLSPHFPPNFIEFVIGLANRGINVLGIAEDYYDGLDERLKNSLADYYQVGSMEDYDQVYRAAAFFCHKWGRIASVESNNEYWMMLEGKLREDFNIPGPKIQETINLQKKSEMKKLFIKAGAPVADGMIITDRKSLDDFIKKHGYPVFAKPDRGVGGAGGFKITNEDDVANFWLKKPEDCEYFVEEFVDGALTTFDGLVNKDGEVEFTSSLYSPNSAHDLLAKNDDLSFYINRVIPADQEEIGRRCLKEFNLKARFFHLEFLRKKDGSLIVMEMNCRAPGGYTVDLMNYANDVNIYQEWANMVAGNHFQEKFERKYYAAHISRKDGKNYLHDNDEIFASYGDKIASYQILPPIFADVMGNEAFLVRAETEAEIAEMVKFIQEKA